MSSGDVTAQTVQVVLRSVIKPAPPVAVSVQSLPIVQIAQSELRASVVQVTRTAALGQVRPVVVLVQNPGGS